MRLIASYAVYDRFPAQKAQFMVEGTIEECRRQAEQIAEMRGAERLELLAGAIWQGALIERAERTNGGWTWKSPDEMPEFRCGRSPSASAAPTSRPEIPRSRPA